MGLLGVVLAGSADVIGSMSTITRCVWLVVARQRRGRQR